MQQAPSNEHKMIEEHYSKAIKPETKLIKGFIVYLDEFLGKGQYGQVCKAKKASEAKNENCKIYACKIMEVANIDKKEMACIEKEVMIHNMLKSDNSVKLYSSIKTSSNLYMMMDYCNGNDLQGFLKLRRHFTQVEACLILRQIIEACKEIWSYHIIHRDIKLANILLHFPDNPEVNSMTKI